MGPGSLVSNPSWRWKRKDRGLALGEGSVGSIRKVNGCTPNLAILGSSCPQGAPVLPLGWSWGNMQGTSSE